jgi:hypothetical protein
VLAVHCSDPRYQIQDLGQVSAGLRERFSGGG